MSSSNSQMRHKKKRKKAALLALWALVVGKSKRRGRLLRPCRFFWALSHRERRNSDRSRSCVVRIASPIARAKENWKFHKTRGHQPKRGWPSKFSLRRSNENFASDFVVMSATQRQRSVGSPTSKSDKSQNASSDSASVAKRWDVLPLASARYGAGSDSRVSFFFVCAMMMCFFVYFVSPFSCVFWKRYKTRKKTKRVSLTLLRSSLLQKKPSDYKRSWCRWWPPRTRVSLRFQMVITFSAGSAPSKAPKVRRTKTWNIRWRCRLRTSTRSKRRWWNFPPRVSTQTSISLGIFVWIFWKSNGRRRITWGRFCCPFRVCWESRITIRRWIRTPPDCGRIKRSIESCCRRSIRRTGQRSKWELGIRHAL